jgi:hypothetical protein
VNRRTAASKSTCPDRQASSSGPADAGDRIGRLLLRAWVEVQFGDATPLGQVCRRPAVSAPASLTASVKRLIFFGFGVGTGLA